MNSHLTDEEIFELAFDKLNIANPNVDKLIEIAELLDLQYDEEQQAYKNPNYIEFTEEQMQFEMQQAEVFFGGGNKKAGQIVQTKTGLTGITYNRESLVNGKIKVYTENGKLLCDPTTLKLVGFID